MVTDPEEFEEWFERAYEMCTTDPDCLMEFLLGSMEGRTPEGAERVYEAFQREIVPRWVETVWDEMMTDWVTEPRTLQEWVARARLHPELEPYVEQLIDRVIEEIMNRAIEVADTNPRAARHFRRYYLEVLDEMVRARAYGIRITYKEMSRYSGWAKHDYENASWWFRRFVGVDLGP